MSKYVKIMDVSAKGDGAAGKAAPRCEKREIAEKRRKTLFATLK